MSLCKPVLSSLVAVLALLGPPAHAAGAEETAKKAHDAAAGAAGKTEAAVKKGGSATSEGIQKGVKAANKGVDSVAKKAGLPAGTAADAKKAQESLETTGTSPTPTPAAKSKTTK